MIDTGTSSLTITIDADGCHHDATVPLNCPGHHYEHAIGRACRKCHEQFWLAPSGVDPACYDWPEGGPDWRKAQG